MHKFVEFTYYRLPCRFNATKELKRKNLQRRVICPICAIRIDCDPSVEDPIVYIHGVRLGFVDYPTFECLYDLLDPASVSTFVDADE